jgi:DNA-binding NarL/FixJ family response regulator
MRQVRVVIVDDEPLARARLSRLLSSLPQIEIVAECSSGSELIEFLSTTDVDALFLDIQMPGEDAFSILEQIPTPYPDIIFVTAYNSHAVRAFEIEATDYLVKPISLDRLRLATDRLKPKLVIENRPINLAATGAADEEKLEAKPGNANILSKREIQVLKWTAIGKTSWEISSILEISERTVNFHLGNITNKLGVSGRRAACSLAIAKGLISL